MSLAAVFITRTNQTILMDCVIVQERTFLSVGLL